MYSLHGYDEAILGGLSLRLTAYTESEFLVYYRSNVWLWVSKLEWERMSFIVRIWRLIRGSCAKLTWCTLINSRPKPLSTV